MKALAHQAPTAQVGWSFLLANLQHIMAEDLPGWARRWEQKRRGGRTRFIWVSGVCKLGLPVGVFTGIVVAVNMDERHGFNPWVAAILVLSCPVAGYLQGLVRWNVTEVAYVAARHAAQNHVKMRWPGLPWWYSAGAAAFFALWSALYVIGGTWVMSGAAVVSGCYALGLLVSMGRALRRRGVTSRPRSYFGFRLAVPVRRRARKGRTRNGQPGQKCNAILGRYRHVGTIRLQNQTGRFCNAEKHCDCCWNTWRHTEFPGCRWHGVLVPELRRQH